MLKMLIRFMLFSITEAFCNLKNNSLLSLLTTGTVAVAMSFLGFFVLVFINVENIASVIQRHSELIIFVKDGAPEKLLKKFRSNLRKRREFAKERFLSKKDALIRFKTDFGIRQSVLDSLGRNPFPVTIILELKKEFSASGAIEKLAVEISENPVVEDVEYGRNWIEKLDTILFFLRFSMFFIGSLLGLGLIFIVSNAIKLSVYFRKDEIDIMKLVGAPRRFIIGPFVLEGMGHGFAGASMSICFLYTLFFLISNHMDEPFQNLLFMGRMLFLPSSVLLGMVFSASAIGFLAANLSLHNLIRIRE